jgi:hypothetical protein
MRRGSKGATWLTRAYGRPCVPALLSVTAALFVWVPAGAAAAAAGASPSPRTTSATAATSLTAVESWYRETGQPLEQRLGDVRSCGDVINAGKSSNGQMSGRGGTCKADATTRRHCHLAESTVTSAEKATPPPSPELAKALQTDLTAADNSFARCAAPRATSAVVAKEADAGLVELTAAMKKIAGLRSNLVVSSSPTPPAAGSTRVAQGIAKTLGAGNYLGGTDVAPGLYNVTVGPGQSGFFTVQGTDSYDERLGDGGVPEVRARISTGDQIAIVRLFQVNFTPVTTPYVTTHTRVTLYAGTWTVGQDLGPGRYVATPGLTQKGTLVIATEGVDATLAGNANQGGRPNVTFTVKTGDVIAISQLSQVTLAPT